MSSSDATARMSCFLANTIHINHDTRRCPGTERSEHNEPTAWDAAVEWNAVADAEAIC
jgi:hypothetical protein